jgi:hypothetical protein
MGSEMKIDINGDNRWYNKKGKRKLHRLDGPAVEYNNGNKLWYKNGKLHREDGPAVEWSNGYKEWYRKGKLHNEFGPAIIYTDGREEYWIEGKRLTKKEFYSNGK